MTITSTLGEIAKDHIAARMDVAIKLVQCVDNQIEPPRGEETSQPPPCEQEAARILVIDDEPINIKVIQKYLQDAGYKQVRGITDPTFAMAGIAIEQPDVILLDVMMPRVSGLDLLASI